MIVTEKFKLRIILIHKMAINKQLHMNQANAMLARINYAISHANRATYDSERKGFYVNSPTTIGGYHIPDYLTRLGVRGQGLYAALLGYLSRNPKAEKHLPKTDVVPQNGIYAESRRDEISRKPQETSPPINTSYLNQSKRNKTYLFREKIYDKYATAKSQAHTFYLSMIEAFKKLRHGVNDANQSDSSVLIDNILAGQEEPTDNNIASRVVDIRNYRKPITDAKPIDQNPVIGGLEEKLRDAA